MNFAIIGCGHIAKKHAEAIQQIPEANLVAVCDKVPSQMDYFTKKYKAKPYANIQEMLENEDIDVVNICTPSGYHAGIVIEVAKMKKHVIVEKPVALTLEDTDEMIKVCRENQVKLSVVHPNRFRPVMIELRKLIDSGLMGKMSHINATVRWNRNQAYYDQASWRGTKTLDGGVLMNQAIHNLDLLLWFMGEPAEVFSMIATRIRKIETDDVAVGVVRFKSGALGVIEAATTVYPENLEETLSLFGETGTIKVSGRTANVLEHIRIKGLSEEEVKEIQERINQDPFGKPGHQWIIEDMIDAIKENREPAVTGEEGRKALQLVIALYKAAETGKPVKL